MSGSEPSISPTILTSVPDGASSAALRITPTRRRRPKGTRASAPRRTRSRRDSGTSYVKELLTGTGRAMSTSTPAFYRIARGARMDVGDVGARTEDRGRTVAPDE